MRRCAYSILHHIFFLSICVPTVLYINSIELCEEFDSMQGHACPSLQHARLVKSIPLHAACSVWKMLTWWGNYFPGNAQMRVHLWTHKCAFRHVKRCVSCSVTVAIECHDALLHCMAQTVVYSKRQLNAQLRVRLPLKIHFQWNAHLRVPN